MRHQPTVRSYRCQNAALGQVSRERGRLVRRNVDKDDVRLRPLHLESESAKPVSQPLRILVILGEALHMVLESVQSGGRKNACLAHPSSEGFTPAPCRSNQLAGSQQDRPGRGTQSLRQAHGNRIESRDRGTFIDLEFDHGIEQSRPVKMRTQAARVNEFGDGS